MSRALGIRRPLSSCLPAALVLAVAAQLLLLAAPAAADKQGPSMSLRESLMKVRAGVLPGPRPAFVDGEHSKIRWEPCCWLPVWLAGCF